MRLTRLIIKNFRNFQDINIALNGNIILLGENRVGKSNLLFALRLVLDPTLPDSARQLKLSDFWDGCDLTQENQIEVHVDFSDFDNDNGLMALLTDFRLADNYSTARLSYTYRKKDDILGKPTSGADYEFIVYGGNDESRIIPNRLRRRIALDMLGALRDAEEQLGSWRNSPLRPLIEDALGNVSPDDLQEVATDLGEASKKLENFEGIKAVEESLRSGILNLAGKAQDIDARLRFAPADPLRLFRSITMFIDDGKRSIAEASLGSANIMLIALKLAEFAWRRAKNERNYSLLCIEESESHLHPHLQRAVFRKLFQSNDVAQALIVTSHSPVLASIAPLSSIVHLKTPRMVKGTIPATSAFSLANLPVSPQERDDIEHYLTATRAEILFSRGVIFVEGVSEETLLPAFANAIGINLDDSGITICNVAGTNFVPYVKLAGALGLPLAVITDWDPLDGTKQPLGKKRTMDIWDAYASVTNQTPVDRTKWDKTPDSEFITAWQKPGIFLNEQTFETSIINTLDLKNILLDVLNNQNFGEERRSRLAEWRSGEEINQAQFFAMVKDIGKGRLSAQLREKLPPTFVLPPYITNAIKFVAARV